jgi:anaerobic ribonucleoside-triphosphate reductase activating protein
MNYSKIIENDFCAAPKVCVTLFVSGCALRCPGCHNAELWDEYAGQEFTDDTIQQIIKYIGANGFTRDLCLMGGDPFYSGNPLWLCKLITKVKEVYPRIKVYAWTGYTYEQLSESPRAEWAALLKSIDCLIDGPFILEQRDITLPMRGSRNQRILELKDGKIIS